MNKKNNDSKIKNHNQIVIKIIIGLLILLFAAICITYAYWTISKKQSDTNELVAKCLQLEFTDGSDAISIKDLYPVTDFEGMQTKEYTFTVKNICNRDIDYRIDLDSLVLDDESNRLSSKSVAVLLDYGSNFIEHNEIPTYNDLESVETTDSTLKDKKVLAYDTVLAGATNTHKLRMWIDESSGSEDESKDFEAKISISAGQGIEKEYTDSSCFTFDSSTGTITAYDVSTCGTDIVIPYEIDGTAVTAIGNNIANNKSLTSIEIPRSVKTIGSASFSNNTTLTKLIFKDGLVSVANGAFNGSPLYDKIHNLILPSTVKTLGASSFGGLGIQRLIIPSNVTSIGTSCFTKNKIKELSIGSGLTTLSTASFGYNYIENLVIPDNITTIGNTVFYENPLKSITIGSGVTSLGNQVFYYDGTTTTGYTRSLPDKIVIPSNVVTLTTTTFKGVPTTTSIYFDNCQANIKNAPTGDNITYKTDGC